MNNKELHQREAYIILAACIGLIAGCVLLNISLVFGFAFSIMLSCYIFFNKGFTPKELVAMMRHGLIECRILFLLILLIGATVSILLSSGVVPTMIYYGFEYMKGMNFLFISFVIVAISSVFMGTAIGTVSTIGLAILGIGKGFGIPTTVLLGVIVSGAFLADKISPISGLLNLTLSATNTNYKGAIKSMLVTLIPTILLTGGIFYYLGTKYTIGTNTTNIFEFQRAIKANFFISPFLLLVPVLIVVLSFFGFKIIYSISTGLMGGVIISFIFQGMTIGQIITSIFWGYKGSTASLKLNEVLISGGVASMLEVLLIVMGAISLSSILEKTGLINYVTNKVISKINSKGELIIKTGLISGILTIVTCDQTMGIILPGRLLRDKYAELNLSENVLARTISDTGTIIAPLMPWNVNSLLIGLVAGTKVFYSPFAVLCYISPLITLIYGFIYDKLSSK